MGSVLTSSRFALRRPVHSAGIFAAADCSRERGFVHESGSQDEARAALIDRWRAIENSGVECGIEAYTNRERIAVNALAREEWRALGRLAGADVALETTDGKTPYAIGDRVIIRETIRESRSAQRLGRHRARH